MTTRSSSGSPPSAGGKQQQVREQATKIGHEATQAGGQLAHSAAGQGKQVASETGRQARNLAAEASEQLRQQAEAQQKRAADGLRSLSAELQSMASNSGHDGVASEVVRRASGAAEQAAGWLEGREPGDLVNEVRDYARQRPGAFLAGAVVAGLLVGRLTRNVAAAGPEEGVQGEDRRPEPGGRLPGMPAEAPPTHPGPVLDQATGTARVPDGEVTR
ncbi:hypothetical protein C5N14_21865 [Micromonospora sp. MW-13]|uniref:hypothetical protein n=1 Tax=Micromonospora sp. MW-13 TaxID=2094022 RepID=UPI000ECBFF0E|nr:hypothetical protein [Micromonospora sp. MW-13]RGC66715.1 hypothetical protein C5N14_21865 [Micromonospora sp. MW-13]